MSSASLAPSGDQFAFSGGGYDAVVTESGGSLRLLTHAGRPLVDGFGEQEMSWGGRGQLLMPWPNRVRDGRYSFGGKDFELALSEPSRRHASHGLARWAAWTVEEHTAHSVSLQYRLMAQSGYPWTVDLHVLYDLSADGLTVTQTATNMSSTAAPYACGGSSARAGRRRTRPHCCRASPSRPERSFGVRGQTAPPPRPDASRADAPLSPDH